MILGGFILCRTQKKKNLDYFIDMFRKSFHLSPPKIFTLADSQNSEDSNSILEKGLISGFGRGNLGGIITVTVFQHLGRLGSMILGF
jgi:hypothetical protein